MSNVEQLEAVTGLEPGQISLVPHDSTWSDLAAGELERIKAACPDSIIEAEHIGSSSVPGIMSRPVLDLLIGVQEMMQSGDTIQPLKQIGYRCHGEQGVPGRRLALLTKVLTRVSLHRNPNRSAKMASFLGCVRIWDLPLVDTTTSKKPPSPKGHCTTTISPLVGPPHLQPPHPVSTLVSGLGFQV